VKVLATDRKPTGSRLIAGLELYALKSSMNSSIDAIKVTYDDSSSEVLGARSAALSVTTGVMLSTISGLGFGDPVKRLYLWYDRLADKFIGLSLTTRSGKQLTHTAGSLLIEDADVTRENEDLGSGVLAAVAAVTYVPPNSGNLQSLVAVNFAFLQQPWSSAVMINIPEIPIESTVNAPFQFMGKSAIRVTGTTATVTCPDYQKEEYIKHYYSKSDQARAVQAALLRTGLLQQQFSFSTSLRWQGANINPADGKPYGLGWTGNVENIFSTSLTAENGNGTPIRIKSGQVGSVQLGSGETARCVFTYAMTEVKASYTAAIIFAYDLEAMATWTLTWDGVYNYGSATEMRTDLIVERQQSAAFGARGELNVQTHSSGKYL
jgi:hypothetical protein